MHIAMEAQRGMTVNRMNMSTLPIEEMLLLLLGREA
jgi:hypothetical protein